MNSLLLTMVLILADTTGKPVNPNCALVHDFTLVTIMAHQMYMPANKMLAAIPYYTDDPVMVKAFEAIVQEMSQAKHIKKPLYIHALYMARVLSNYCVNSNGIK